MYRPLLHKLCDRIAKAGWPVSPPVTAAGLDRLNTGIKAAFGYGLPPDYQGFLAQCDGLSWDGLTLYGAEQCLLDGDSGTVRPGLLEANALFARRPGSSGLLFLGHSGEDCLVFDFAESRYLVLDMTSLEIMETPESFEAMMVLLLRHHL